MISARDKFPHYWDLGAAPPGAKSDMLLCVRSQAKGAWPNDTRVIKQCSDEADTNPDGTEGRILGSVVDGLLPRKFGYFIEWDTYPGAPIFCQGHKLRRA